MRANFGSAFEAVACAAQRSRNDGRLRFAVPRGLAWAVSLKRPAADVYWTNGREAGCWHATESNGRFDPVLTAHVVPPEVLDSKG